MDDCPTIGLLTTRYLSLFMLVVRRLMQFCLVSVKCFIPAYCSVSVSSMFVSSCKPTILNGHMWVQSPTPAIPTLILPCLHLWNLRNCSSMACLRNPEGLFGCPSRHFVCRQCIQMSLDCRKKGHCLSPQNCLYKMTSRVSQLQHQTPKSNIIELSASTFKLTAIGTTISP